eukprot:1196144-Prorocentrum_minimum.AAC.7
MSVNEPDDEDFGTFASIKKTKRKTSAVEGGTLDSALSQTLGERLIAFRTLGDKHGIAVGYENLITFRTNLIDYARNGISRALSSLNLHI